MTTTLTTPKVLAIFRDTVSPGPMDINDTFQGVFAYAAGKYAWPTSQISRYVGAGKHLYRIDPTGRFPHLASIVDAERGDATWSEAGEFVRNRNDINGDGGAYASLDNVPLLLDAIGKELAWLWVADWTGAPHVPALELPDNVRLAAVQYDNTPGWDLSAVYSADWLAGRGSAR
jgi:hypothetical protein